MFAVFSVPPCACLCLLVSSCLVGCTGFSVVIPTRNRASTLHHAIRSALNQPDLDLEIIVSDNYSFLDMTSDDLSAKGGGGTRQMHSYASLDFNDKIQTPEDNYDPNKVNEGDLEKLQRERDADGSGAADQGPSQADRDDQRRDGGCAVEAGRGVSESAVAPLAPMLAACARLVAARSGRHGAP